MASITFGQGTHKYPVASAVSVFARSAKKEGSAPQQAAVAGPVNVAADGSLTFTGLADNTQFVAYALVGSSHEYQEFATEGKRTADLGRESVQRESLSDLFSRVWLPGNARSMDQADASGNVVAPASGTLLLCRGGVLPAGRTVSRVGFVSGTTAGVTLTAQSFCLVNRQSLAVVAKTVDDAATAWAANSLKELLLAAPYTPAEDIELYIGLLVAAATVPTLAGIVFQNTVLAGATFGAPVQVGTSNTGLTTPASIPSPVTAPTVSAGLPLCWAR